MNTTARMEKSNEKFGQYLHALQDLFSHQPGQEMQDLDKKGRGFWQFHGTQRWIDNPYLRHKVGMAMAKESYEKLRDFYKETFGAAMPDNWKAIEPEVRKMPGPF